MKKNFKKPSYFELRPAIGRERKVYTNAALLQEEFSIDPKLLIDKFHTKPAANSQAMEFINDKGDYYYDYDFVVQKLSGSEGLPRTADDLSTFLCVENKTNYMEIGKDLEFQSLLAAARERLHTGWPAFVKYYKASINKEADRKKYARMHGLFDLFISAMKDKWPRCYLFFVFVILQIEEMCEDRELLFTTNSYVYFYRKLIKCKKEGIPTTLIHASLGVAKEYCTKLTRQMKADIRLLLRNPRNFTNGTIAKKIEAKYGTTVSSSTISRFKNRGATKSLTNHTARGPKDARTNGMPKLIMRLAENAGEIYEADYYNVPFLCKGGNRDVIHLFLLAIIDVFSRKIVGWSTDVTKSSEMAIRAFRMAFINERCMPLEIIIDQDSLYKQDPFKRFVRRTQNLGVVWKPARANRPTDKPHIEALFATLQKSYFSGEPWYKGDGIGSRNKYGNPSREYVKYMASHYSRLLTADELIRKIDEYLKAYNASPFQKNERQTRDDFYRLNLSMAAPKFTELEEAVIFWNRHYGKKIEDDGAIRISVNGVPYLFQVTDPEMFFTFKESKKATILYDERKMDKVYFFDLDMNFKGVVEGRMTLTRSNKKFVLSQQGRIIKNLEQFVVDRYSEDRAAVDSETLPRRPIRKNESRAYVDAESETIALHEDEN